MNTPLYDYLISYSQSDTLRCHMPGHKGGADSKNIMSRLNGLFDLDITEISGADSLFEADGIIAESERNMSQLYGSAVTVYSAGGSTLCIQAMLTLMKQDNRKVFAVRNVHRAFLNACALLDIDAEWIMPEYNGSILSGEISLSDVEKRLKDCRKPSCLYITSPDYTGKTADIRSLAEICHRYGAKLIVDNAHGAHLAFMPENIHPINLGADLCCDSAHKMLPALTGSAMLHTSCIEYADRLKQAMSFFGSTSPSYLIMASLDLCCEYISCQIKADIKRNSADISAFRNRFSDRLSFADGELFHITVKASESGYNGNELAQLMRENGAECEYSDDDLLILLMSPVNVSDDYIRLAEILEKSLENAERHTVKNEKFSLSLPEKAMSVRDAVFSPTEEIPVDSAEGRICASVKVPCPPAIPIASSGEIISRECINIFKKYGILTVNVVKYKDEELLCDIEKIHTTEQGAERIRNNMSADIPDADRWCRDKIADYSSVIRKGKNLYYTCEDCVITVNAKSCTVITVHPKRK